MYILLLLHLLLGNTEKAIYFLTLLAFSLFLSVEMNPYINYSKDPVFVIFPPLSCWADEYLINCNLGESAFTDIVLQMFWLHCPNASEYHKNDRPKQNKTKKTLKTTAATGNIHLLLQVCVCVCYLARPLTEHGAQTNERGEAHESSMWGHLLCT